MLKVRFPAFHPRSDTRPAPVRGVQPRTGCAALAHAALQHAGGLRPAAVCTSARRALSPGQVSCFSSMCCSARAFCGGCASPRTLPTPHSQAMPPPRFALRRQPAPTRPGGLCGARVISFTVSFPPPPPPLSSHGRHAICRCTACAQAQPARIRGLPFVAGRVFSLWETKTA